MGGGGEALRDPGDQVACRVHPPGVSVENHWGDEDANLVAPVGCVADPVEGLVLRQVLCRRHWAGVLDRWAEARVGECKRWWDGRGQLDVDDVEGHPTSDGVGGDLLFSFQRRRTAS